MDGVRTDSFIGGKAKDLGIEAVKLHKGFCKKGQEGHLRLKHLNVLVMVVGGSRVATSSALVHAVNCSRVGTHESFEQLFWIRTGATMTSCPWRVRMRTSRSFCGRWM